MCAEHPCLWGDQDGKLVCSRGGCPAFCSLHCDWLMIWPPWAAELAKAEQEVTRHCVLKHGGGRGSQVITVSPQAHKALNFLSLIFLRQGFWQAHKIRSSQIHTGDNDYNRTGERYKCQNFFNQFEDCDLADLCRHCKWLVQNFPTYDCLTGRSERISIIVPGKKECKTNDWEEQCPGAWDLLLSPILGTENNGNCFSKFSKQRLKFIPWFLLIEKYLVQFLCSSGMRY